MKKPFQGAKANYSQFLGKIDTWFLKVMVPKIPQAIETYHLTLFSGVLALCNIGIALKARENFSFSALFIFSILLHHGADLLDGAVGRYRNTGLELWGYYMDKFIDFIYVASLSLSFLILFPETAPFSCLLLLGYGGLMVETFLFFAATGISKKNYTFIGPTEVKAMTIIALIFLLVFGKTYALPVIFIFDVGLMLTLIGVVFNSQRILWKLDMANKRRKLVKKKPLLIKRSVV